MYNGSRVVGTIGAHHSILKQIFDKKAIDMLSVSVLKSVTIPSENRFMVSKMSFV